MTQHIGFTNFSLGAGEGQTDQAFGNSNHSKTWKTALNMLPMRDGTARRRHGAKHLVSLNGAAPATDRVFMYTGKSSANPFTVVINEQNLYVVDLTTLEVSHAVRSELAFTTGAIRMSPITAPDDILITHPTFQPLRVWRADDGWHIDELTITDVTTKIYDGGYPSASVWFKGRLYLAGNPNYPGLVWASKVNELGTEHTTFNIGSLATDGLELRVDGAASRILQMESKNDLILFAEDGIHRLGSSGAAPVAGDVSADRESTVGYPDVALKSASNGVLSVAAGGFGVQLASYNWQNEAWRSLMIEPESSEVITEPLVQVAPVPEYYNSFFASDESGKLINIQPRGDGIHAWSKHDVGGDIRAIDRYIDNGLLIAVRRGDILTLELLTRKGDEYNIDGWTEDATAPHMQYAGDYYQVDSGCVWTTVSAVPPSAYVPTWPAIIDGGAQPVAGAGEPIADGTEGDPTSTRPTHLPPREDGHTVSVPTDNNPVWTSANIIGMANANSVSLASLDFDRYLLRTIPVGSFGDPRLVMTNSNGVSAGFTGMFEIPDGTLFTHGISSNLYIFRIRQFDDTGTHEATWEVGLRHNETTSGQRKVIAYEDDNGDPATQTVFTHGNFWDAEIDVGLGVFADGPMPETAPLIAATCIYSSEHNMTYLAFTLDDPAGIGLVGKKWEVVLLGGDNRVAITSYVDAQNIPEVVEFI